MSKGRHGCGRGDSASIAYTQGLKLPLCLIFEGKHAQVDLWGVDLMHVHENTLVITAAYIYARERMNY